MPEDILTEDDILKLLDATQNLRDKAIISLLFDSGARIAELLGIRIKDIDLSSEPAHVRVDGKTGPRVIPLMFSAPYLGSYLETLKSKKPTDFIWIGLGTWSNSNMRPDYGAVRMMLQRLAKKATINKRVNPHSFRHARATNYANKLTEQQLKRFFGWTGGSAMAATYVHLSGKDIDGAVLEANGEAPKAIATPKLKNQNCRRCKQANGVSNSYCSRCGAPLDINVAMMQQHARAYASVHGTGNTELTEEWVRDMIKKQLESMKKTENTTIK